MNNQQEPKQQISNNSLPTLAASLTKALFVGLFVMYVVMFLLIRQSGGELLKSITDEHIEYVLATQAETASEILWDLDKPKLTSQIRSIVGDKHIIGARIKELYKGREVVYAEYGWRDFISGVKIISKDIMHDDTKGVLRKIGSLEIAVDYRSLAKQINKVILSIGAFVFLFFVLLSGVIYLIVRSGINPITELSKVLSSGVNYFVYNIKKQDAGVKEVAELFDALVQMQQIMQKQTFEIEDQKVMLNTIIDKMPVNIFVEDVSVEQNVVLMNEEFKKTFGLKIGKEGKYNIEDVLPKREAGLFSSLNAEIFRGNNYLETKSRLYDGENKEFIAQILKTAIKDSSGSISLIITIFKDVTKDIETQKYLVEARDAAEKANASKSEFLANMSHELRTPLNGVIGAADLLKKENISKDQSKYLEVITHSGEVLLTLINDILDLSKIEAGELLFHDETIVITQFMDNILHSMASEANKNKTELLVEYDGEVPYSVTADSIRLKQIMVNLISNATKFVKEGYVAVKIEERGFKDNNVFLRVSVKDNGIGIAEEKLKRIFDKFIQADSSTTKKYGGSGLGLAVTKKLVELMGGNIGVESQEGVGTTFWFEVSLPVVEFTDVEEDETVKDISSLKVLVLDDQEISLQFMSAILNKMKIANHEVVKSSDEAIKRLKAAYKYNKPFDVILVDYELHEENGVDFSKTIQENEEFKDIKRILVSALGKLDASNYKLNELLEAGLFNDYLLKPVNPLELHQRLYDTVILNKNRENVVLTSFEIRKKFNIDVLLVENDVVNQIVANDMLESLGCNVDLAENGKQALELLDINRGKYKAVFMDCLMPILDGFEATQEIRSREKDSGDDAHQLIIAMTANAMAGENLKCIEVGMDDYLAKPVTKDALYNKLKKYIKNTEG